ncbi:MAG: helix-turn-helix domain-containing protein [Hydrotalea sp.]|nr:helix-turn-helix domain-containing protein [Hydrotalea sp.]
MNIGKAIKQLRKQQGLSQSELAKVTNITQAALSGIENGNRPSHETLANLCNALKVPESLIYVLGIEREDVPSEKKQLYDSLFPVIQDLIFKIGS